MINPKNFYFDSCLHLAFFVSMSFGAFQYTVYVEPPTVKFQMSEAGSCNCQMSELMGTGSDWFAPLHSD